MDQRVSGENRFFYVRNYLENGWIYKSDDVAEGFYFPDLGEGLVIAENAEAGIALMHKRLMTNEKACFPIDNCKALRFFEDHHQQSYGTAKRMRLGKKRPVMFAHIYNRIAGNLG